jgi:hypothetical protein
MNLFRSEEHARCWSQFGSRSEEGFISLTDLASFFGTESRQHMLDGDYLSAWYPRRAAERRAYLESIGKTSPFWMGTPDPPAP